MWLSFFSLLSAWGQGVVEMGLVVIRVFGLEVRWV